MPRDVEPVVVTLRAKAAGVVDAEPGLGRVGLHGADEQDLGRLRESLKPGDADSPSQA
jgi:hypothetical protein